MKTLLLALLFALSTSAIAEVNQAAAEIPTDEKAFVDSINGFDKSKILEQLGEPSMKNDITNAKTGKMEASIWHYHYLNTDAKGEYYQTTELDFIDDKVVMVVFMNNDGEELPNNAKPVPAKPESQM